jgi:hypothetical protein
MRTGEFFGDAVTNVYQPHDSSDIVALVAATQSVFGEAAKVDLGWKNGHYVSVSPSDDLRREACDNDSVWPRMVIRAPYNGAFDATMGVWRDACSNLHIMREVTATTVTIRHTSGLRDKMEDLLADFSSLRGSWETLVARMQAMARARVNLVAFLDSLYPIPAQPTDRSMTIHRNRTESIVRRIQRERAALGNTNANLMEVSAWEAFNGLGGYLIHDKPRRGKPGTFDRAVLAMEDTVLARAESALLAMAV